MNAAYVQLENDLKAPIFERSQLIVPSQSISTKAIVAQNINVVFRDGDQQFHALRNISLT